MCTCVPVYVYTCVPVRGLPCAQLYATAFQIMILNRSDDSAKRPAKQALCVSQSSVKRLLHLPSRRKSRKRFGTMSRKRWGSGDFRSIEKIQTIKLSNYQTIKLSNHQTIKPPNYQTIKLPNYRATFPLITSRSFAPKRYLYSSFPRMKSNSLRPCSQAHCRLWDSSTQPGDNSMKSRLTPEL